MEKLSLPVKKCVLMVQFVAAGILFISGAIDASTVGGESGAYLRYPSGAAALAMGGAYSANPGQLRSWWNPSLLCRLEKREALFGGGIRPFGQSDAFAGLELRLPPRMGLGFFLLYRGDPFIDNLVDENENPYPRTSYTTFTGKIAFSYYVNRKVSAGCNIAIRYVKLPSGFGDGSINTTSSTSMGSFDFVITYQRTKALTLTAQLKNVGASMDWNFTSLYDYNVPSEDNIPPSLLLGSSYSGTLHEKPVVWNTDVRCYLLDGSFKKKLRPEIALSSGIEWRYWDNLHLRFGVGDMLFNGDIASDPAYYWSNFSFKLAGGVSYDLSKIRRGMRCNYGCSTDKVWAGVDQQVDITLQF